MGHTLGKRSRSTLLSVCFAVALAAGGERAVARGDPGVKGPNQTNLPPPRACLPQYAAVLLSNASAAPAPARHAKAAPAKAAPAKAAHAHAQPKFLPVPRPRPRTAAAEVAPAAAAAAPAADKAADKAPAADKADTADKAAPADKAPAAAKADKAALADKAPVADKAAPADKAEKAADAKAPLDKWRDASAPLAARVSDLLSRLTLDEKLQMLTNKHMAVPRLGVKFFDLLNGAAAFSQQDSCRRPPAPAGCTALRWRMRRCGDGGASGLRRQSSAEPRPRPAPLRALSSRVPPRLLGAQPLHQAAAHHLPPAAGHGLHL